MRSMNRASRGMKKEGGLLKATFPFSRKHS